MGFSCWIVVDLRSPLVNILEEHENIFDPIQENKSNAARRGITYPVIRGCNNWMGCCAAQRKDVARR
jgi:hypothetical protein